MNRGQCHLCGGEREKYQFFLCRACSYATDEHWFCYKCGVVEPMETEYCKICSGELENNEV